MLFTKETILKTPNRRKNLKRLYALFAKKVESIQVPSPQFAMIDGVIEKGDEPAPGCPL